MVEAEADQHLWIDGNGSQCNVLPGHEQHINGLVDKTKVSLNS